jgi:hypothetical protein
MVPAVPPEIRRFLPLIALALFAVLILPSILHGKKSGTTSASTRATSTIAALGEIDSGEKVFKAAHGKYTDRVADVLTPKLADNLALGLVADLNVSTDGQTYYASVASDVLSVLRARQGDKQIADSCVVIKSGGGVKCPVAPAPPTSTTPATTTK